MTLGTYVIIFKTKILFFYFLDVDTNAESSLKCKSCSLGKYQNIIQS